MLVIWWVNVDTHWLSQFCGATLGTSLIGMVSAVGVVLVNAWWLKVPGSGPAHANQKPLILPISGKSYENSLARTKDWIVHRVATGKSLYRANSSCSAPCAVKAECVAYPAKNLVSCHLFFPLMLCRFQYRQSFLVDKIFWTILKWTRFST